jgi:endonuclease YncB( thermonuclease family)
MKTKLFIRFAILVFLLAASAQAAEFNSRIKEVIDADSLMAVWSYQRVEIRLWGVDAPEWNQAYGKQATEFTESLALGKRVKIIVVDRDRYTRLICRVILPDGRDLGEELVRAGLAWYVKKYAPNNQVLAKLHEQARADRRGRWQDPKPKTPWWYRQVGK